MKNYYILQAGNNIQVVYKPATELFGKASGNREKFS